MSELFTHTYFMKAALKEAEKALALNEVPVGCIVVCDNKIIGKGHNLTEQLHDVTAHAEMQAITAAANYLGAKYLENCTLYVTLEPCIMCAGALYWSQIERVVYGAADDKRGFTRIGKSLLHPKTELIGGVLQEDCSDIIKSFFKKLRI